MIEEDRELYDKIWRYGLLVIDHNLPETWNLDMERISIYNLEGKLYWIRQFNGEPIEIKALK